jgi:hypothetical protein
MIALPKRVSHWRTHAKKTTGDAMTVYDLLQFNVCVFSVLAAGFWLQAANSRLAPVTKSSRQVVVCFHKH